MVVCGASLRPGRLGTRVWAALRDGGYPGLRLALNRHRWHLDGEAVYDRVEALPQVPDLALVCTPARSVRTLVRALGARGCAAVVVLSPGLTDTAWRRIADLARGYGMALLGPRGPGLIVPGLGLHASRWTAAVATGGLALIGGSDGLTEAVLDAFASSRPTPGGRPAADALGFSQVLGLGAASLPDVAAVLEVLATEPSARAIVVLLDHSPDPRRFLTAARWAARHKPVVVHWPGLAARVHGCGGQGCDIGQPGRNACRRCCERSHDAVCDVALAQACVLRVRDWEELLGAIEILGRGAPPPAGGLRLLGADDGLRRVAEAGALRAGVTAGPGAPSRAAASEPASRLLAPAAEPCCTLVLCSGRDGPPPEAGLQTLLGGEGTTPDGGPGATTDPSAPARPWGDGQWLVCWLDGPGADDARRRLRAAGIPVFDSPDAAVAAYALTGPQRRAQAEPPPLPPSLPAPQRFDGAAAQGAVRAAWRAHRSSPTEPAPAEPVTEPPWVRLQGAARQALLATLGLADAASADLTPTGCPVQPLLDVGVHRDPVFGLVMQLGALRPGGLAQGDDLPSPRCDRWPTAAVALLPLDGAQAQALLERSAVGASVRSGRLAPGLSPALARALSALSDLVVAVPALAALQARLALDGRSDRVAAASIWLRPTASDLAEDATLMAVARIGGPDPRFALHPYASDWVTDLNWRGQNLTVRPVRAEDEAQHLAFLERLEPGDIRRRVLYTRRSISRSELAQLVQVDPARELALLVVQKPAEGPEQTLGVVRASWGLGGVEAGFGIIVRSDLKGQGLGVLLLERLIEALSQRGLQRLSSEVLTENEGMRRLAQRLGFVEEVPADGDGDTVIIARDLAAGVPHPPGGDRP